MFYNGLFNDFICCERPMSGDFFLIVPGFTEDEISVTQKGRIVTITGKSDRKDSFCFVNSDRTSEFNIEISLESNTKIKKVSLKNGLLFVKTNTVTKEEKEVTYKVS